LSSATSGSYDAIVVGGGHNGLVTACYLAKAKWKVLGLERRHVVGGACVTEEVFPRFKVSRLAYVNSLFRPEIVRDLRLREYGFESLERNPSSFSPFPDGRYLMMGPDAAMNTREIAKFSTKDAEAYPKYEQVIRSGSVRVVGICGEESAGFCQSTHARGQVGQALPDDIQMVRSSGNPPRVVAMPAVVAVDCPSRERPSVLPTTRTVQNPRGDATSASCEM
jgi:hypothetical protein